MTDSATPPSDAPRRVRPVGAAAALVRGLLRQREASLVVFIVIASIAMSVASAEFLTAGNLKAVLLGMAAEGIVAVGMAILLVSGGFDLSIGSVLALGGIVAGRVAHEAPAPVAILAGIAIGLLIGFGNGMLVAKVRINPLIATLGTMTAIRGVVYLAGGGFAITNLPHSFDWIGQATVLGVQAPIIVLAVFVLVGDVLLRRSRVLRYTYYVGGNEHAARLTGIPVDRVKIGAYALTGALAGLAGVITAARFGSASVSAGLGLELIVIAGVVIGGASLSGGSGTVLGAIFGVLLIELINNAFNLLAVNPYWQPVAQGTILILAVVADQLTAGRAGRSTLLRRRPEAAQRAPETVA